MQRGTMNQDKEWPPPASTGGHQGPAANRDDREEYLNRDAAAAGGREIAEAELDVYCPEHGGYRNQDCRCARPGPGQTVKAAGRCAAFAV